MLSMLLLTFPVQSWAGSQDTVSRIKAAYIHQFSHFVSWPDDENNAASSRTRMTICIMGHDRVGEYLERLSGHGHGAYFIEIRHPSSPSEAHHCEVLYIAPRPPTGMRGVIGGLARLPVLTVSAVPGFVDQGGMIGFVIKDDRVRLEINLPAVQRSRLHVSAKLIEVSLRVIQTQANGGGR